MNTYQEMLELDVRRWNRALRMNLGLVLALFVLCLLFLSFGDKEWHLQILCTYALLMLVAIVRLAITAYEAAQATIRQQEQPLSSQVFYKMCKIDLRELCLQYAEKRELSTLLGGNERKYVRVGQGVVFAFDLSPTTGEILDIEVGNKAVGRRYRVSFDDEKQVMLTWDGAKIGKASESQVEFFHAVIREREGFDEICEEQKRKALVIKYGERD